MFKASNTNYFKPPIGAEIKRDHPLARELAACWLFNESKGNLVSNIVIGDKANFVASPIWTGYKNGSGIYFTAASSQYILVPYTSYMNIPLYITVESYARYDRTGAYGFIVSRDDGGSNRVWNMGIRSSNLWFYAINHGGTWTEINGPAIDAKDHHVVMTYDGINVNFYLDGVLRQQNANTGAMLVGNNAIDLGAQVGAFNNYWQGPISYVRVWNRALNSSEINWLYREPYSFIRPKTL